MNSATGSSSPSNLNDQYSLSYIIFISLVAALGGFLFGFDSGVINGTVTALSTTFETDNIGTGFNVASVLLGCALGALTAGPLADKVGRKPVMLGTAIIFAISAYGSGAADSSTQFILYRLFGGVGIGAASVLAPAYIAEISPSAIRGRLASLQQMAIVLGLFFAFLSNYLIAESAGGAQAILFADIAAWRWMFWVELIPAVLFFFGVLLIPESPRYLVAQNQTSRALAIFKKISSALPEHKVAEVKESLHGDEKPRLRDLFIEGQKKLHPIIWVGVGLSVFQQFVGINVVFYYGAELWQAAGFKESDALFINVLTGTTNVLSTLIAIALIDKIGRKPLLMTGSLGMFVSLGILTYIFANGVVDSTGQLALTDTSGTVALIAANLFVVFFGLSWGPVVWVLLGEIFNNRIRGAALAFAASIQWLANFAITMTFPIMLSSLGLASAYGFYTLSALFSAFFVIKFIKETKGKTLESM